MTYKLYFVFHGLDVMVHDFGQVHHQHEHNCLELTQFQGLQH